MGENSWGSFWKNQKQSFHTVMRVSTTYFARQLVRRFSLNTNTTVLDYGCGPGFLIDSLSAKGAIVTGADINPTYLEENKKKFPQLKFIQITDQPAENKLLIDHEVNTKFDFIILLSIIQYFRSKEEVSAVISNLGTILKPGGKIIVGDVLDENTSSMRDAWAAFMECVKRGKAISFARFVWYLMFSDYSKVSRAYELLKISQDDMLGFSKASSLTFESVKGLAVHPTRANYVLTKA